MKVIVDEYNYIAVACIENPNTYVRPYVQTYINACTCSDLDNGEKGAAYTRENVEGAFGNRNHHLTGFGSELE